MYAEVRALCAPVVRHSCGILALVPVRNGRLCAGYGETRIGTTEAGMSCRAIEKSGPDKQPPDFEQLRRLAIHAINEHTDRDGQCGRCASDWPCEQAVNAEHTLAVR